MGTDKTQTAGESRGYVYHTAKVNKEVLAAVANRYEVETKEIQVEICKRGIINALNRFGGHPDNR